MQYIEIQEIHTHNLKGFNLKIPLNSLVVITGPSGSGKSSLAINTIAEEGKNRLYQLLNYSQEIPYNPALKAKFSTPLPPIIPLTQGIKTWYPYKIVAEFFSIYQTLGILFEEYGEYKCPNCGKLNKITKLHQLMKWYQNLKDGEKFYFLLPLYETSPKALEFLISQGYTKYLIDDKEIDLSEEKIPLSFEKIYLILDRMIKEKGSTERLIENLRISLGINQGRVILKFLNGEEYFFNLRPVCLDCGTQLINQWIKCSICKGQGYKEKEVCKACQGLKLDSSVLKSELFGKTIQSILNMSLKEFYKFFKNIKISEDIKIWLDLILSKVEKALFFDLDYLKLSTPAFELSVGEKKLLELLLILGANVRNALYILDEPTLGLDINKRKKLLEILKILIKDGNSIILVEHDPFIISHADFIIELGPGGGENGGYLIKSAFKEEFLKVSDTLTSRYLKGERKLIPLFSYKGEGKIEEININTHKIKILSDGINLIFGDVGSKKTLIFKNLYKKLLEENKRVTMIETEQSYKRDELIISWLSIWDSLREILINIPASKIKGLEKRHFSFHTKEGICFACKGKGKIIKELGNLKMEILCEECLGKRLNKEVLNLVYKGFKISEILDFTVEEVSEAFGSIYKIKEKTQILKNLSLSYLCLSQSINELSGGEKSRLFMAKKFLEKEKIEYLFLEFPFRGLHLEDIKNFSNWLRDLIDKKITVIILETNPIALFLSKWIIEVEKGRPKFVGYTNDWLKNTNNKNILEYKKFFKNLV